MEKSLTTDRTNSNTVLRVQSGHNYPMLPVWYEERDAENPGEEDT
jgi:hypothetical protein